MIRERAYQETRQTLLDVCQEHHKGTRTPVPGAKLCRHAEHAEIRRAQIAVKPAVCKKHNLCFPLHARTHCMWANVYFLPPILTYFPGTFLLSPSACPLRISRNSVSFSSLSCAERATSPACNVWGQGGGLRTMMQSRVRDYHDKLHSPHSTWQAIRRRASNSHPFRASTTDEVPHYLRG